MKLQKFDIVLRSRVSRHAGGEAFMSDEPLIIGSTRFVFACVIFFAMSAYAVWCWWHVLTTGCTRVKSQIVCWPDEAFTIIIVLAVLSLGSFPIIPFMIWRVRTGKLKIVD